METKVHEGLKNHLMREALQQNEKLVVGSNFIDEDNSGIKTSAGKKGQSGDNLLHQSLQVGALTNLDFFSGSLIDIRVLRLPFDGGTGSFATRAITVNSGTTTCNKFVTRSDVENGELNVAAVQGQLFDIVYPNPIYQTPQTRYINETCSLLSKTIDLESMPSRKIRVKAITRAFLPQQAESVYYVDPGTLNLSEVGVEGTLFNTLSYRNTNDSWQSNSSNKTFLRCIKKPSETVEDNYINQFEMETNIIIPPGITQFNYSTRIHAKAFSSLNIPNANGLDGSNYGLALVDLRNRLTTSPIAIRPLTNEFTAAPGGVFIYVVFEFYRL